MRIFDLIDEGVIDIKASESSKIDEINIDNEKGLGSTPNNRNVSYKGLRILMRPKTFLRLAAPLNRKEARSADNIKQHIQQGGSIASPFLVVDIPGGWNVGDFSTPAKVISHDGRNRMWAVEEEEGNDPIEVHMFFTDGFRNRDIKLEWIEQLKQGLIMQGTSTVAKGPLFKMGHDAGELDEVYPRQSSGKLKNWIKNHYGGAINCTKAARLKRDSNASTFYKKRASWYQSLHCK